MEMQNIRELEPKIGYVFIDEALLRQALTRPVYAKNIHASQEPLSILGDAILKGLLVERAINKGFSCIEDIHKEREKLENNNTLIDIANLFDLSKYILTDNNEQDNMKKDPRNDILAETVEALIGAIYLDRGYEKAQKVVNKWYDKL